MRSIAALLTALIGACVLSASLPASAQIPQVSCPLPGYTILFVNGVWNNSPEDVALSLDGIRDNVGTQLRNGRPVRFTFAYNKGKGVFSDVFETFRLRGEKIGVDYTRMMAGFQSGHFEQYETLTPEQKTQIDAAYAEVAAEQAALYIEKFGETEPDFASVLSQARNPSRVHPKDSLILVGHSEGTVFNQLLYYGLRGGFDPRPDAAIRILAIASAASDVPGLSNGDAPGSQAWVTNTKDLVIGALRKRSGAVPVANVSGSFFFSDPSGHFLTTYMEDTALSSAVKSRFDAYFLGMQIPVDTSCQLELESDGIAPSGWTVSPKVTMSGLQPMSRANFWFLGSPGNTCGGERGGPLWSLTAPIAVDARFFGAGVVSGAPYQNIASPNRRPCSSFVAVVAVPDPEGQQLPRYRIWANATGRAQTFGGFTLDWEYQMRYDSGDPWSGLGRVCNIGTVPGSGTFVYQFSPSFCRSSLVPL
jgi:hypothetical protein